MRSYKDAPFCGALTWLAVFRRIHVTLSENLRPALSSGYGLDGQRITASKNIQQMVDVGMRAKSSLGIRSMLGENRKAVRSRLGIDGAKYLKQILIDNE